LEEEPFFSGRKGQTRRLTWVGVVGVLVLTLGFLAAFTLAVFVTHHCGVLGVNEFATCGATRAAVIVAVVTLLVGVPLLWIGARKSRPG